MLKHQPLIFALLLTAMHWGCDDNNSDDGTDTEHNAPEESDSNGGYSDGDPEAGDAPTDSDEPMDSDIVAEEMFIADIEQAMSDDLVPGMAVAIVAGGEVAWQRGFGYGDLESKEKITTDTPFPLASISKTFIGTTLMQLEESGEIDIDDDINSFGLPFAVKHPGFEDERITLRNLANHTSGILDDDEVYECLYYIEADQSSLSNAFYPESCPEDMPTDLGTFLSAYLSEDGALYADRNFTDAEDGRVGEVFNYSNIGAALAAFAVETATGVRFETLCEENIFAPLGMTNTHWHSEQFDDPSRITGLHVVIDEEPFRLPPYAYPTWPDGGLKASVADLARYFAAISAGGALEGTRILSESKVREMLASQTDGIEVKGYSFDSYGIFWLGVQGIVGHTGGDFGVTTAMLLEPNSGVGIVLLVNLDSESMNNFGLMIQKTFEFGMTF